MNREKSGIVLEAKSKGGPNCQPQLPISEPLAKRKFCVRQLGSYIWSTTFVWYNGGIEPDPGETMLTYKAAFRILDDGVHAEVLDFPGAMTCAASLEDARKLPCSALMDMAETSLLAGQPLPTPNSSTTDSSADVEEPIHLLLTAASQVAHVKIP